MPFDPRADYEIKVAQAARNIIFSDTDITTIYRNKELYRTENITSWEIHKRTLILFTIPAYPALAIHLDGIDYLDRNGKINIKLMCECAWQDENLDVAKENTIRALKHVRYTIYQNASLFNIVDGELTTVGDTWFSEIEPNFFGQTDSGDWTHISSMTANLTSH